MKDFARVCDELAVERVIIAFSALSTDDLLDVIRAGKQLAIKVSIVPRLFEVMGAGVEVDQLQGLTLLGLRGLQRSNSSLLIKRAIDLTVASVGVILLFPVLLAVSVAIKLSSPGPVLFRQRRIGRGNEPFTMFKFRTMVDGADTMKVGLEHLNEADGIMFKITDDPRITPLGRWLRKTSIDELPQLLNVLRGEMSLVGPRPLIPREAAHVIGWHRARLDLTPGLTGPWQVLGRTAIPFQEMVKLDYVYVAEWSLWNDIILLLRTLPVVISGAGHSVNAAAASSPRRTAVRRLHPVLRIDLGRVGQHQTPAPAFSARACAADTRRSRSAAPPVRRTAMPLGSSRETRRD